ncbi:MAG: hypothetical protein RIT14_2937 [Pseudomonadota bacterium]|jgi:long-chain acyl-CoA synthetase
MAGGADRFIRHPAAQIIDGQGQAVPAVVTAPAVIAALPSGPALAAALARGAQGLPFRIGAPDQPAPLPGPVPMLETLTSGSSGQPRRIWRSQASWCASFAVNAGLFGIGPGVAVAVLGRLDQSLSLYAALEAAVLGAALHLMDALRPDRQRAALAARRVAVLYATPAQLRALAEAKGPVLGALRHVIVGGSKLDPGLRAALGLAAPGAVLREFYGAAEASFITLADATTPPESVGRPYPAVALRIGGGLAEGALGEVWVQSPYVFTGYAGHDGSARWQDGWLSVGEMGWLQGGQLYLAGRAGRMVTVADQNVFPEGIEAFLMTLPGVSRAAVLPRPDLRRGAVMLAVLQGDPAQEAAILRAARARFGPLVAPRAVVWRRHWPELASGKTDLARLQIEVAP